MKRLAPIGAVSLLISFGAQVFPASVGITPEQIFQPVIVWDLLMGTWEVLSEETPLAENAEKNGKASPRTLMTLRKDGTCRVFNKDHPSGSDGLWSLEGHHMYISFPNSTVAEYFVYGVKGDFMVTRTPIKDGHDQLWSRVK